MSKIYTLEDLLAQTNTPLSTLGVDNVNAAIQAHVDFLNQSVSEQMELLAEETSDARRIWGGSEDMEMIETDEFGDARTQAPTSGVEVGFPLRKFSVSTGWSNEWYMRAMANELSKKTLGAQHAYLTRIQDEIRYAVYNKANYSYKDYLVDNTTLGVKAFLNNDGSEVPSAPNGTAFASTHNHYLAKAGASLAATDIDSLVSTVVEHGGKGVTLFVDSAMPATMAGLASTKFVKLTMAGIVPANTSDATLVRDNVDNDPANKLVGYWDGVPVFTRSWVPTGYIACMATGAAEKPLVYRVVKFVKGLVPVVEFGQPTITAKIWRAYFGVSAWNRSAGAVLDSTHTTTYSNPSGLVR